MTTAAEIERLTALLEWQAAMGADEAVGQVPADQFAAPMKARQPEPARKTPQAAAFQQPPSTAAIEVETSASAAMDAKRIAAACHSLDELKAALEQFDACPLKRTATNLCFYDGNLKSTVMLIGEAPGRDEDIQAKPFVGRSGQLLDRMLAHIGLSRQAADPQHSVLISNAVFWRPPGNRKPTMAETMMCLPFLDRMITLLAPKIIVCLGATPAQRLTGQAQGIFRLRGNWFSYQAGTLKIPLLATFHPAFLLRNPQQKRQAWSDMLKLRTRLDSLPEQQQAMS